MGWGGGWGLQHGLKSDPINAGGVSLALQIIKSLIKPVEKLIGGGQTAAITGTATA